MRILVVGGTGFIGTHLVEHALAAGHDVTLLNRGRSGLDLFPGVRRLVGDRDGDLSALVTGAWDATVDTCAYVPRQVRSLADVLGGRGGHHLLVSSVSVYGPPFTAGYDESAPLVELEDPTVEEVTDDTYGGLKVLCERAAVERHGAGSTTIVRPTYVVGPDDVSWRFPWWVTRIARGGEVLAPGPPDDPAQVIDVRDLAAWMLGLVERRVAGALHAVGPAEPITWGALLDAIVDAVAPAGTTLTWVDQQVLRDEGLDGGVLPLWHGGDPARLMAAADPAAAIATGLHHRALADTIVDTLEWARGRQPPAGTGLAPEREHDLLRAASAGRVRPG